MPYSYRIEVHASTEEVKRFRSLWEKEAKELENREKITKKDIDKSMYTLKKPFLESGNFWKFSQIDFDTAANCCAYLLKSAAIHSSLTKFATEEFIEKAPVEIVNDLKSRDKLTVVSLGGGPGNDAIGFYVALAEKSFGSQIDICVLDKWKGGKSVLDHLVERDFAMELTGEQQNVSEKLKVSFEYQQVDLVKSMTKVPLIVPDERIRIADVILCVKLFSILTRDEKRSMLRAILKNMKPGSILLYVDIQSEDLIYFEKERDDIDVLVSERNRDFKFEPNGDYGMTSCKFDLRAVYKKSSSEPRHKRLKLNDD